MGGLSAALQVALEAVRTARTQVLAECARADGPRGEIGNCPVDTEVEWVIRARLLGAFPTYGFLGEETGEQAAPASPESSVWVVDPNDGTSSMQRGYRGHAVSVGLIRDGQPVLGVVCAVDAPDDDGDLFAWAEGCGPLRRNGVAVERPPWPETLGPDDVVALSQAANRNPLGYGECVAPARFVGLPSIAYRLALVAAGEYAATVSLNALRTWDYAAGHALLRSVRGILVDHRGAEISYSANGRGATGSVFAGGPALVEWLLERPWNHAPGSGFGEAAPPPGLAPVRPRPGRLVHNNDTLRRAQGCLLGQIAGAGQPTEDSELAVLLARTLIACDGFDAEQVAAAYGGWYHGWSNAEGPTTCAHDWCTPVDVGRTTARALEAITPEHVGSRQAAAAATAAAAVKSQANGALMRVSPLGVWGALRDQSIVADAAKQDAQLTHPHPVCQDASAVFTVALGAAINNQLDPPQTYRYALDWAHKMRLETSVIAAIAEAEDGPPDEFMLNQGWVLVALRNAFHQLLHAPNLESGVIATVRAGGDTDTNAAICGALLGAVYGRDALPLQWQQMVLTRRPMPGWPGVKQPRPALYWPTDALVLAERLLTCGGVQ